MTEPIERGVWRIVPSVEEDAAIRPWKLSIDTGPTGSLAWAAFSAQDLRDLARVAAEAAGLLVLTPEELRAALEEAWDRSARREQFGKDAIDAMMARLTAPQAAPQ